MPARSDGLLFQGWRGGRFLLVSVHYLIKKRTSIFTSANLVEYRGRGR